MAHIIELTDFQTKEPILYNLDTVVSIERVKEQGATVITTRWGRNQVVETLDQIRERADGIAEKQVNVPF